MAIHCYTTLRLDAEKANFEKRHTNSYGDNIILIQLNLTNVDLDKCLCNVDELGFGLSIRVLNYSY